MSQENGMSVSWSVVIQAVIRLTKQLVNPSTHNNPSINEGMHCCFGAGQGSQQTRGKCVCTLTLSHAMGNVCYGQVVLHMHLVCTGYRNPNT